MDYKELDDVALLRLIAHSNEPALSELYDRYSRLVFGIAFHSLGDINLAEEVAQDVFIRLWKKASTYQPGQGKVSTWITSITRHRAIDLYRRVRTRPTETLFPWDTDESLALLDQANTESEIELKQQRQRVRNALAQLSEVQRQTLYYAYFQGLSHNEIAKIMRDPLGTVKTRIRTAMQKLREILQEETTVS